MAKKDKADALMMNVSLNKKIAKRTQDNIDNLYKSTYYSDNKDRQYIDSIRDKMNQTLNGLIDKTRVRSGDTNISDLYARTLAKGDRSLSIMKDLTDSAMLSDILELYSNNMVIRDMDREIDVVLKYVPRLYQGLRLIKQAVLSADHMDRESTKIAVINAIQDPNKANDKVSSAKDEDKIKACKKKYDWKRFQEELYEKTSKYGEQYVYILPYTKALERVVKNKEGSSNIMAESYLTEQQIQEAVEEQTYSISFKWITGKSDNAKILTESVYDDQSQEFNMMNDAESINVEFNASGYIPSIVTQASNLRRILSEVVSPIQEVSLKSNYGLVKNSSFLKNIDSEMKKFAKDSLKAPSDLTASDGFTNDKQQVKIEVPGCIVEMLKHEYVKPLYIGKCCLGYYYIESDRPMDYDAQTTFTSTLGGLRPRRSTRDRENLDRSYMDNAVLRKIAKQISEKIDRKFINANQDLAEEIYTILKYNSEHNGNKVSKVRISFIPPEDIVHSYFKMHEHTHRGISDLELSLFPAKLYSCLYISNAIALLTRGYDKRVYHVKQVVDTNIKAVLLNVINQIKMGNFGLRQIENMNNILNITGRFNDLVIPQNANGESPVNMEVLPGQNIDIKNEFMNHLEEMAIELLGVSMEMISSHFESEQSATNVVQNNERLLILVYQRQELYSAILSQIFTKIYQCEYGLDDIIEVELPPPNMLKLNNVSQLMSVGNDVVQNIVQMMGNSEDEFFKGVFTGKLMEYFFGSFLDMEKITEIYKASQVEVAVNSDKQQNAGSPGGGGGGMPGGY